MNNIINKEFLRAKELAELLGIGESTIWAYVKQGKIKARKISERITVFNYDEVKRDLGLVDDEVVQ